MAHLDNEPNSITCAVTHTHTHTTLVNRQRERERERERERGHHTAYQCSLEALTLGIYISKHNTGNHTYDIILLKLPCCACTLMVYCTLHFLEALKVDIQIHTTGVSAHEYVKFSSMNAANHRQLLIPHVTSPLH